MPRHVGMKDILKMREQKISQYQQAIALSKNHIERISKHRSTEVLTYESADEDCKRAIDFVDKRFPESNVKSVTIYVSDHSYLERLGYRGIGGFFSRVMKVIVIPDSLEFKKSRSYKKTWGTIRAKIEFDEVVAHELLHYVSDTKGASSSPQVEEEFAYGNSYPYLKAKGYSDKEIIKNNFLPYLISAVDKRTISIRVLNENGYSIKDFAIKSPESQKRIMNKLDEEIFRRCKSAAEDMGLEIIRLHSGEVEEAPAAEDRARKKFDMLDL